MIRASRIPRWFGAQALTVCPSLILIVPERMGDKALIAHEEEHAEQQDYVGTLRFWWHYLTDADHRLMWEVQAYRVQIEHGGDPERCAKALSTLYRLDLSLDEARSLLS